MKKLQIKVNAIAIVALATLILTACGQVSKPSNEQQAADSTVVESTTEEGTQQPVFTNEGIAPVLLGTVLNDLPEQVEGLYASKAYVQLNDDNPEEAGADDIEGWYFYDAEGNTLFTAEDNGKGKIGRIMAVSPKIKTAEGAHAGMTSAEIAEIQGIKKDTPNAEADYQRMTYTLGEISIAMDWDGQYVANMSVVKW